MSVLFRFFYNKLAQYTHLSLPSSLLQAQTFNCTLTAFTSPMAALSTSYQTRISHSSPKTYFKVIWPQACVWYPTILYLFFFSANPPPSFPLFIWKPRLVFYKSVSCKSFVSSFYKLSLTKAISITAELLLHHSTNIYSWGEKKSLWVSLFFFKSKLVCTCMWNFVHLLKWLNYNF